MNNTKNLLWYSVLVLSIVFTACSSDDDGDSGPVDMNPPVYTVTIMSPDASDKAVGENMHIHVNFDEADLETVHHINVSLYESGNPTNIIHNSIDVEDAHVHEESGHYEYHADVSLDVDPNTTWTLEAKVWGHEAGLAEVTATRSFQVLPNDCTPPSLAENIVGTWKTSVFSVSDVEFFANGDLSDVDNALIFFAVNGLEYSDKSWEAIDDNNLLLTAKPPMGSGVSTREFKILRHECNEIDLGVDGSMGVIIAETLIRD